jgi:hypothetical protein
MLEAPACNVASQQPPSNEASLIKSISPPSLSTHRQSSRPLAVGKITTPDAPAWTSQVNEAFTKLNSALFGPQEYAVIATAAPPEAAPEGQGAAAADGRDER